MSSWKEKFTSMSDSLKATAGEFSDKVSDASKNLVSAGKEHITELTERTVDYWNDIDWSNLVSLESNQERFHHYYTASSEKLVSYYRSALEVDKSTADIIKDVRQKLPVPAKTFDDIFDQCKHEAIQRATSVFFLAPVMQGIDQNSEGRYSNLSLSYGEFQAENNLHDHPNFAALKNERYTAQQQWSTLENGYHRDAPLNPYDTDIEHIIPKSGFYRDIIFRLGTNDDQLIEAMNASENLTFANASVNRSKRDKDGIAYVSGDRFKPDPHDPDLLRITIDGVEHEVRRSDVEDAYAKAVEKAREHRMAALKNIGIGVASASAAVAAQQVVGLILTETIDIFVDEVKDFIETGKLFSSEGLSDLKARKDRITAKLSARLEEKKIWDRARAVGVEGAIAGALSAIPMIIISVFTKLPALVLALIRECTLSTARCVRLLSTQGEDRLEGIKVIMLGTASAATSIYIAHLLSKAIKAVPILQAFDTEVAYVLSGVIVLAVPLAAIYVFERNKSKFTFNLLPSQG